MNIFETIKFFLLFFFSFSLSFLFGQNISAYIDYKNYFSVFDDGIKKELEYFPIQSYKVGGNSVVYIDQSGVVKAYYKGIKYDLSVVAPVDITATDDLVVFYVAKTLNVFDEGESTTLSILTTSYIVGDSIVGFFDDYNLTVNIYYQKTIIPLEDIVGKNSNVSFIAAGDNILAYTNTGHFYVYFHQQIFELETSIPTGCEAGNNIVVYMDGVTQNFKAFYNGVTYTLENFRPKSYKVADDMVAYIDNTGRFKIFYKGKTIEISSFEPSFYQVNDNLVVFAEQTNFQVFYKGNTYTLENYIPSEYQIDFNTIAYKNKDGYLIAFIDGRTQKIFNEKIILFRLSRDVLMFTAGLNDVYFFLKGKIY